MPRLEEKLNRVLRPIKEYLGRTTYDFVRASGSIPGIMYGLVKTHKVGYPVRPIVSAIKTFNYNSCKFVVLILAPFTCNQFTIFNSATFFDDLKSAHIVGPTVMVSFDVQSLYTNVFVLIKLL